METLRLVLLLSHASENNPPLSSPHLMELHHDTESDLEKAPLQHDDYISQIFFLVLLFRTGTSVGVCSYDFSFNSGLP